MEAEGYCIIPVGKFRHAGTPWGRLRFAKLLLWCLSAVLRAPPTLRFIRPELTVSPVYAGYAAVRYARGGFLSLRISVDGLKIVASISEFGSEENHICNYMIRSSAALIMLFVAILQRRHQITT